MAMIHPDVVDGYALTVGGVTVVDPSRDGYFRRVYTSDNGNGQNVKIGDDVWLGDINASAVMSLRGVVVGDTNKGFIRFGSAPSNFGFDGANLVYSSGIIWHSANLTGDQSGHYHSADRSWANITGKPSQATLHQPAFSNGSATAGWCNVGTYTGDSLSRFAIRIHGKQGWNDQDYCSMAYLHGGTNFISSDAGQIAAGCKWTEFVGSGQVADEIRLVRQSGHASYKFDVYIKRDVNFVAWMIEFVCVGGSWTPASTFQVADPGTGTNVFQAVRTVNWDSGNLTNLNQLTNGPGYISLSSPITGYSAGANTALAATDTLLVALGKVQGQINSRLTANQVITLSGDISGSGATSIAGTVSKIDVTEHSANNTEYSVVWDNGSRQLFHTAAKLKFNPSLGRLTATAFAGPLTGNASTATLLQNARTFALTGVITATAASFNGSANISLSTEIADGALSIAKTSGLLTALNSKVGVNAWNDQAISIASTGGSYFTDTSTGDLVVRFGTATNRVRLGVFDGASGTNSSSIWYSKDLVGINYQLVLSTSGFRFPDNAFGGTSDSAGVRLVSRGGENQSFEIYCGNDIDDWVNLVGSDNNFAKINTHTIWNAGNLPSPATQSWVDSSYVQRVGSGTFPYTIDNGSDVLTISNGVALMSFDATAIGVNKLITEEFTSQTIFTNELRFGFKSYQDGATLAPEQGVVSLIGDGANNCTVTLPSPSQGRILILGGKSSYTAPLVERVTPAFASHIRYVNSSNTEVIVASGDYFSIKGRCVMLVGVSSIQWQLVGGFQ